MAEGDEIGFSGHGWPQYRAEIEGFAEIMKEAGARSYLEVGCLYGDTLHYVGSRMPAGSRIIGVDLPGQAGKRFKDTDKYLKLAVKDLRQQGYDAHCIIGDSHKQDVIAAARSAGPYDAIFIDGDHSIDGVRKDWENYGGMGKVVGFHDICRQSQKYQDGVRALYLKLAEAYENRTLSIGDTRRGIGVIFTNRPRV